MPPRPAVAEPDADGTVGETEARRRPRGQGRTGTLPAALRRRRAGQAGLELPVWAGGATALCRGSDTHEAGAVQHCPPGGCQEDGVGLGGASPRLARAPGGRRPRNGRRPRGARGPCGRGQPRATPGGSAQEATAGHRLHASHRLGATTPPSVPTSWALSLVQDTETQSPLDRPRDPDLDPGPCRPQHTTAVGSAPAGHTPSPACLP